MKSRKNEFMNKYMWWAVIQKKIYRLRLNYGSPHMRKLILEKIMVFVWMAFLLTLFGVWSWFIWTLCRPGLSIWESCLAELASYALIGFTSLLAENVAIPVQIVK